MEILAYPFMQRALLAALLTGIIAPAIGIYIVQRRLSLLGDGLGHVAIAGVGLALMTGQAPIPWAVAVCVAGAVVVEILRQQGKATGDVGLAILFYGGLAAGVLMSGIAGQGAAALSQYLFGSLTTVTAADLAVIGVLAVLVLVPTLGLAPQVFAVSTDEEFARTQGLRVRLYNILIVVLAAVTVTLAMRTVGLLLVSALMVVPVAAAQNLVRGFYAALITAMVVGVSVTVGGAMGSFYLDTPPGALIVVLAIVVFVLSWPYSALISKRRRVAPVLPELVDDETLLPHVAVPEAHPHKHGPDCEHPAIRHGDHTDYVHEGHRHAQHGDHYDEH
ncbi:putative metal ABC transporter permease protein [Microlunatus phosphovorus NM-1]|uniref:Putative metal ABC transporter permease protein n=1 Tax=Microlunatus phosphovorus (strain ATCC 700054 / DSM 10555 / JCM 9379 / NBRC 101784 / NCIMB 13414 / VKM Ac-1990 / NM-1) TaxID=1032480 RepID=F5XME8_MICPN|nr:metal ABC transporter permease [Microlunatus phosphovorus]BAK36405.1 putative metal ABC transporter permease protein [Microlunatus phosphovorus NM-1]